MPYRLIMDDGGRGQSKRRKQVRDCTVRALAIATCESYDRVYDELARAGRKCSQGFELTEHLARHRSFLGHPYRRITFRSHTTIKDVVQAYQWGRVIVDLEDHVYALIDGVARDLWRGPDDTPVLGIWRFI